MTTISGKSDKSYKKVKLLITDLSNPKRDSRKKICKSFEKKTILMLPPTESKT